MGFQPVLVAENKELNGFWLPHDLLDPHESPSRDTYWARARRLDAREDSEAGLSNSRRECQRASTLQICLATTISLHTAMRTRRACL